MSFYDDASLVFLPSGGAGKDTKAYSIKPTNGDGDFTFSRGSNLTATRVDSNGLIEKGRENLLLQSNTFDTTWTTSASNLTSGQSGYDGTSDAWLLTAAIPSGFSSRINQVLSPSSSGVLNFSVYAKADTLDWILLDGLGTNGFAAWFDVSNGVKGQVTSTSIGANITSVGNGWYRCEVYGNATTLTEVRIYVTDGDGTTTANDGDGCYIQDAQLEQSMVATEYIESGASTGLAGILEDSPRFDYSGGASCPSLLLEPSSTNLFQQSEYYNTYFTQQDISVTDNARISPEGLQNASKLIPDSGTGGNRSLGISLTGLSGIHTFSVFAKEGEYGYVSLRMRNSPNNFVMFDLSDGSVHNTESSGNQYVTNSAKSEDFGNGWYRLSASFDPSNSTTTGQLYASLSVGITGDETSSFDGDGTSGIFIYGMQFCEGSYPTSYIPNHSGGSVTREEDTTAELSLSPSHGSSNTWFFELKRITNTSLSNQSISIIKNDLTGASNRFTLFSTSNGRLRVLLSDENGTTENLYSSNNSFDKGETIKAAVKITPSGCTLFVDGSSVATSSSVGTITGIDAITYFRKAALKQFLIFPSALSDAECITLTS